MFFIVIYYLHESWKGKRIMAEKYNLKQELINANDYISGKYDNDPKWETLLGASFLTRPDYINTMRANMFTSHIKQALTLKDPEFPKVWFGPENVVGKYSDGYKQITDGDKEVYRKVEKYGELLKDSKYNTTPNIYTLFLYDKKKDEYSIVERTPCEDSTELFGYDYVNDKIDSYNEGDTIDDGTILYHSTSYEENEDGTMSYRYAKNVDVMYSLDLTTYEDAAAISDDFAKEFISSEIETVRISLNDNDYLLNMFGEDMKHYQSLPEIGQKVDGILAASRRLFNNQILYDFRNSKLSSIMDGDNVVYNYGTVLDYTIYCNNPDLPDNTFNRDIIKYLKHQKLYWKEILRTCKEIKKSGSKYTRDINYLYKRAKEFLDDEESRWKEGDSEFGNVIIDVLIIRHVGCQEGQKFSPRYGNKSVISKIIPKEKMPYYYDENGNKVHAKILLSLLAIINRTTAYPLYEMAINHITQRCARYMKTLKSRDDQEAVFFELLSDFDPDFSNETKQIYLSLSDKKKDEYMHDVVYGFGPYKNGIFIRDTAFKEKEPIFYRLNKIYQKYSDTWLKYNRVYINKFGREIPILNKALISEMYVMKLKQTSRKNFSVRNMGAVNSKGLPERSYKSRSHLEKTSSTPIRFGEYEMLNFTIGQPTDQYVLFQALYRTSIKGRNDLAKLIMDPNADEGDISDTYDSRTAEIFEVVLQSLSLKIRFNKDENMLKSFNKQKQSFHEINGKSYLCDEFTAMMLERIVEIETKVFKDFPIINTNELYDIVRDELSNGKHLMGTNDPNEIDRIMNLYYGPRN